jgi:GNAT superfamily N-acetyltransferase
MDLTLRPGKLEDAEGCGQICYEAFDAIGKVAGSNFLDERSAIVGVGPITVDPAIQNRGVGRALIQDVMQRTVERGAPGIRLLQDSSLATRPDRPPRRTSRRAAPSAVESMGMTGQASWPTHSRRARRRWSGTPGGSAVTPQEWRSSGMPSGRAARTSRPVLTPPDVPQHRGIGLL